MYFRRYKLAVSKIILLAMVFASLSPAVSHALALFTGNQSFTQQICTSNGTIKQAPVLVIQVKTTMGQQLSTELILQPSFTNQTSQESIEKHFEHCPFCTNMYMEATLPKAHDLIVEKLAIEAQKILVNTKLNGFFQTHFLPPRQAPPQL